MTFNKFTFWVLFQVLLIAATGFLMVWSFNQQELRVARFTFSILWVLEIIYLLHYVNRTNRSLTVFLESLRASDYVRSDDSSRSFDRLNLSYNQIIDAVKSARLEKESQYHYFQYTLELIPVGVVSFRTTDGTIEQYNPAAARLLGMKKTGRIDDLDEVKPGFAQLLKELPDESSQLVQVNSSFQSRRLLIQARTFILDGRKIKLLSMQNIQHELDQEELNAWQKLISVLRHEIMNSVGPVNSLTRTLLKMFRSNGRSKKTGEITDQTIEDAVTGLQSIENRTTGMMRFVESYRELTKIPPPRKKAHSISGMLRGIRNLMGEHLSENGVELVEEHGASDPFIEIDEKQISQVLINLVKNASEAFLADQTHKRIILRSRINESRKICLEVEDNGPGISAELREKIFVPFFTTKLDGSGIGLNFARQIMHLHHGGISVSSQEGKGSTFVLEF